MVFRIRLRLGALLLALTSAFAVSTPATAQTVEAAQKLLVGEWKVDWEKSIEVTTDKRFVTGLKLSSERGADFRMHFKADGTLVTRRNGVTDKKRISNGKWRVRKDDKKRTVVDITKEKGARPTQLTIKSANKDLITYSPANDGLVFALRRIKQESAKD